MKRREREGRKKSLAAANNLKNSRNDVRLCVYIFVCVHTVLYACVCVCVFGVLGHFSEQPEDTTAWETAPKPGQSGDKMAVHMILLSLKANTETQMMMTMMGMKVGLHSTLRTLLVGSTATRRIPP